jgi:serine protease
MVNTHCNVLKLMLFSPLLCLLLASCGGGGGSGGSTAPNSPPVASFSTNVTPSVNSLSVSLNAGNSTDSDGTISSYSWDFGDGSSGSGVNTSHLYAAAGSYTISLTVTDNDGASNSSNSPLNLTAVNAQFTLSRPASQSISFDASTSSVIGASGGTPSIVSYSWDFGDGSPIETGVTVTHSYTGGGAYSATLTVTDSSGATGTATMNTTFSVSGTVSPASNTAVDIDVNDPSRQNKASLGANFQTNNINGEAQMLPNPVLLNGFASAIGAGPPPGGPSNFETDTDPDDIYSVFLLEGQFVSLRIADYQPDDIFENDLDLELYDSTGTLLLFSRFFTENESVLVPADGQYFIKVTAAAGLSKYLLNIGANSFASGAPAYGNSSDIIAGEAMIKTRRQQFAAATNTALPALSGLSHPQSHQRAALISFDSEPATTATTQSSLSAMLRQNNHRVLHTLDTIKRLNQRADVEYAEPNYRVKPLLTPNDAFYSFQWHYPQINLPQAWDITTGSPASGSVVVAVVDTGVILDHVDLLGQLVDGYDFIRDPSTSNDGDGIDNDPTDTGDGDTNKRNSWHGTHVAGTVAAASDNTIGVAGVSWGAKVMPVRVLGKGGGSSYDVVQGVRYAAGLSNDSNQLPSQPASIINLSLGGSGFNQSTQNLYTQLYNSGTIVIAAAGNESTSTPSFPASYDNVISVSATDLNNGLAPYSNFGSFIDIAAPGGDASKDRNGDGYNDGVLSTLFDEETNRESYAFYEGTSMATPHVAGVAALMKAVYPALSATEFTASLQNGELTNDLGSPGRDDSYGYGIIDALKAVQQAQLLAGGTAEGSVTASPNRVNFGRSDNTSSLTLTAAGQNPPAVTNVSSPASWLSIDASNANGDGTGDYLLTADRSQLSNDAIYSDVITVTLGNGKELQVPVSIEVSSGNLSTADSGYLFLLILDADSYEFVDQVNIDIVDGAYQYQFNNIPFGEYVLLGGSDVDNDFIICSIGESCGNYPTNEQPLRILVDGDKSNLNFLVTMVADIISSAANQADNNPAGYQRVGNINRAVEPNKQLAP